MDVLLIFQEIDKRAYRFAPQIYEQCIVSRINVGPSLPLVDLKILQL